MTKKTPLLRSNMMPILTLMLFDVASVRVAFPILTLLFFDTSSHLFNASTPHDIRSYWYGLCVAIPALLGVISGPLLSCLSDTWGRKNVLLLAIIGAAIAATLSGIAVSIGCLWLFLAGCLVQGIFAKTNPIAQAVIADSTENSQKISAMGYLQTAISMGAFMSPIIGGQLALLFFHRMNYAAPFFASLFFAVIALIITTVYFKESFSREQAQEKKTSSFQSLLSVISLRHVVLISCVLFVSQISWSMYYQYIGPSLNAVFHLSAGRLGLFIGCIALWLAIASSIGMAYLAQRYSLAHLLLIGFFMELVGQALSLIGLWSDAQILLWIGALPTAAGDVIAYSAISTLYSNAVNRQQQGAVMGVCFLVIGLTWSLSALTGGYFFSITPFAPLTLSPLFIVIALLLTRKYLF
jgi:MFS transporter, DHA1 family, tetracycline resistance protein